MCSTFVPPNASAPTLNARAGGRRALLEAPSVRAAAFGSLLTDGDACWSALPALSRFGAYRLFVVRVHLSSSLILVHTALVSVNIIQYCKFTYFSRKVTVTLIHFACTVPGKSFVHSGTFLCGARTIRAVQRSENEIPSVHHFVLPVVRYLALMCCIRTLHLPYCTVTTVATKVILI